MLISPQPPMHIIQQCLLLAIAEGVLEVLILFVILL
nr:MAG TPA: hypothetical protein [Bacteriophage sp.]